MNTEQFDGHTPGPWWVDEWEDGDGESMQRYWSVEQDIIQVCLVHNEQDARLMAAAPDLLAALRELLDAIHWDAFSDDDTTLEIDRAVAERIRGKEE